MTLTLAITVDDIVSAVPSLVTARKELRPVFGGPVRRINRMGSRWAFEVVLLPCAYEEALDLTDLEDEDERVVIPIPQPGLTIDDPGNPVIDGAGQSGNQYALRGLTPGYTIRKGQWMPVIVGGQRYLYRARSAATADPGGQVTVPVRPMIRKPALDGDQVELAAPKVEGLVTLSKDAFKVKPPALVDGIAFTIEEAE